MTKENFALKLEDLNPQEASFELKKKQYTLKVFTLKDRIWLNQRFKSKAEIERVFREQDVACMAEIAHHLLKDKTDFPTFLDFAEAIITPQEQIAVVMALMSTVGIDDKMIKALSAKMDEENPNAEAAQAPTNP